MADYSNSRWKERGSFSNDTLHSYQDIVDAIRTAPYGIDTREAMAQMLIFLYSATQSVSDNLDLDMSPTDAFWTLDELKQKYPNGQKGVYVVQENGRWYFWSELENTWKDGGFYQAAASPNEVKNARLWADGQSSKTLGEAIRSQINQLKQLILNDYAGDNQDHDGQDLINEDLKNRINKLETMIESIEISQVDITNLFDEDLVDDLGNTITGGTYAVATDDTLLEETMPANAKATGIAINNSQRRFDSILDRVNYKYWNTFPILYLDDVPDKLLYYDADKSVKAGGASFRFPFFNNSGRIEKMKVQGASSVKFPKKNYNITFEHPTTLHDAWGARKKYTLKGNFNDSSQARNVVSARIWAGMRKSRLKDNLENIGIGNDILTDNSGNEILGILDKQLALGKGYGTIDGYPIGLVINGKYHGIYNLNIPKDGWMANMKKGKREVIVSADYSATNAEYFQALATMSSKNSAGLADFSIEYISGSDDSWVLGSLNQMIGAVLEHHETDDEYVKAIEPYLDIDSAIDYYIMNVITGDLDANGKNYLLETWDGKKWYFASYDRDSTFGNVYWQGNVLDAEDKNGFAWYANSHRMFSIIYNHMRDRFIQRWEHLRRGVLSDANLFKMFGDFIGRIPRIAFDEENYLWPQTPFSSVKDFSQIMWWITHHMAKLDKEIQDIKDIK
jgi:hypothetical protein